MLVDHAADHGFGRPVLVEDGQIGTDRSGRPLGQAGAEILSADDQRADGVVGTDDLDEKLEMARRQLHQCDRTVVDDLAKRRQPTCRMAPHRSTRQDREEQARDEEVRRELAAVDGR